MQYSKHINPLPVAHLFPLLDVELMRLLKSLSPEDWNKPTLAKLWTVKDIVAHLLDGNIRTLSSQRDRYFGVESVENLGSYKALVEWLNKRNHEWVHAAKRISPQLLIFLLEATNDDVNKYYASLPPFEEAIFSVAWAGEETSRNWMHVAREYTERWHHQQQIRDAVGASEVGIMTRELFFPLIATFLLGLPHTYRHTDAPEGSTLHITISGECGGTWHLEKRETAWYLVDKPLAEEPHIQPISTVTIPPEIAWKLFCKSISPTEARTHIVIDGNIALGEVVLTMISVMA
jgi:uncharacterized protein (TIGR03083 family)